MSLKMFSKLEVNWAMFISWTTTIIKDLKKLWTDIQFNGFSQVVFTQISEITSIATDLTSKLFLVLIQTQEQWAATTIPRTVPPLVKALSKSWNLSTNLQSWWQFSLWNTSTSFPGTDQLQIEPASNQFIKLEMNKPTSKLDSTQNATLNCPISVWERCHQHFTTWIFSISPILTLPTMLQQLDTLATLNVVDQMSLASGAQMEWITMEFFQ